MSNFAKIAAEQIVDDLEDEDRPHSSSLVRALPWIGGAAALGLGAYAAKDYLGHGAVQGAVDAANQKLKDAGQATEGLMGQGYKATVGHLADWTNTKPGGAWNAGLISGGLAGSYRAGRDQLAAWKRGAANINANEHLRTMEGTKQLPGQLPPSKLEGWLSRPQLDNAPGIQKSVANLNALKTPLPKVQDPHWVPEPKKKGVQTAPWIDQVSDVQGDNLSRARTYREALDPHNRWSVEDYANHLEGKDVTKQGLWDRIRGKPATVVPGLGVNLDPAVIAAGETAGLRGAPVAGVHGPGNSGVAPLDGRLLANEIRNSVGNRHGQQVHDLSAFRRVSRVSGASILAAVLGNVASTGFGALARSAGVARE